MEGLTEWMGIDVWRSLLAADIWLPLFSSLVTGMLIGFEREIQGKPAGLRTHALVCFAASLLTLAAARQGEWDVSFMADTQIVTDPTRMAHGILTGIGFLGAGVIFREGPSVQGLTTAASLWITAALGIVFGVGMYWLALAGTIATLLVLVALRVLYAWLPRTSSVRIRVAVDAESGFGAQELREMMREHELKTQMLSQSFDNASGVVEFGTSTHGHNAGETDGLARTLRAHRDVLAFSILPVEDAGVHQATFPALKRPGS